MSGSKKNSSNVSRFSSRFIPKYGRWRIPFFVLLIGMVCAAPVSAFDKIEYLAETRRDPFVPLIDEEGKVTIGVPEINAGEFKVDGIIFDRIEGSYALINGQFYKEGDHLENADLVSILKDRVILSVNDEEKTIWIREEIIDQN